MPSKTPRVCLSNPLKAEWAKCACARLVANRKPSQTLLPSEAWINAYLNSFDTKINVQYRGVFVNETNFFDAGVKHAILGALEADIQVDKKHSQFIPLVAEVLKLEYEKGFSFQRTQPMRMNVPS